MSNRITPISVGGISPNDHSNQPMDLAQRNHSNRISESNTNQMKGVTTTLVRFGGQIIAPNTSSGTMTSKTGVRAEGVGGTTVALLRQPHSASPVSQTPLNLVTQTGVTATVRNISTVASVMTTNSSNIPSAHPNYHIPRGAALVANMASSRSTGLASSIFRTSQTIGSPGTTVITGPRASIVGPRVVPVSSSSWPTRVTSSSAKSPATAIGSFRSNQGSTPYSSLRPPGIATASLRGHSPANLRSGISHTEGIRASNKSIHLGNHSVPHQKFLTTGVTAGAARIVTTGAALSVGANTGVYCPSSTMVTSLASSGTTITSLASSGTTITPHPSNRHHGSPAIAVRITAASSTGGNISSTFVPASSSAALGHHRAQQGEHTHLKTPIARTPLTVGSHSTKASGAAHIAFSGGSKVINQSAGSSLTLSPIPTITGIATHKGPPSIHGPSSTSKTSSFQPRTGTAGATIGRVNNSSVPVPKLVPQSVTSVSANSSHMTHSQQHTTDTQQHTHASVYVHRNVAHSGGTTVSSDRVINTTPQFTISTPFYFEQTPQAHFQGGTTSSSHPPSSTPSYIPVNTEAGRHSVPSAITTISVVESQQQQQHNVPSTLMKPNASPRPSILRKRPDMEIIPSKAAKNLSTVLNAPVCSPPSPKRPDSRGGNGNASSGSTTISANSSPEEASSGRTVPVQVPMPVLRGHNLKGIGSGNVEEGGAKGGMSLVGGVTLVPSNNTHNNSFCGSPYDGLSPRKKPRKQQLMGNELHEARPSEDEFDCNSRKVGRLQDKIIHQEISSSDGEDRKWNSGINVPSAVPPNKSRVRGSESPQVGTRGGGDAVLPKRPCMSLLRSVSQNWKARHNHFARHTDVRPKEEKKSLLTEVSSHKMALQRANGWKVAHLSGQVEDMVDQESEVVQRLDTLLNAIEVRQPHQPKKYYKDFDKDINKISELVKANIQRSKIAKDQMYEAKTQMSKIFEHKSNILEIMTKYGNKRNVRKKERI